METKLYHRDIGFPAVTRYAIAEVSGHYNLVYTRHAQHESQRDKLGSLFHVPRAIEFFLNNVVEVEVTDGALTKLVVRLAYEKRRDLILVLRNFADGAATVITLWTNAAGDTHNTLDKSKYATA